MAHLVNMDGINIVNTLFRRCLPAGNIQGQGCHNIPVYQYITISVK